MQACPRGSDKTDSRNPATARFERLYRLLRLPAITLAIVSVLFAGQSVFADSDTVIVNPVRVTIPAIGVNASVQDVGLADDGSMGVPVGYADVAWYQLGVDPGQPGYSAFTGHISSIYYPGVFYNID